MEKHPYIETVGRRKTSIARVRLTKAVRTSFAVNGKTLEAYFTVPELRLRALSPLTDIAPDLKFVVTVIVRGGGISSQSDAIRHGLGRALSLFDASLRSAAKKAGHLRRDPRAKERRKFGLKKARKAPQWAKR